MNCQDCDRASDCHNEVLNDLQIIECVRMALDHNFLEQAKEELDIYTKRLKKRNFKITGRHDVETEV